MADKIDSIDKIGNVDILDKSAYMLRIAQANPVQLVVINFELIIDYLSAALITVSTGDKLENDSQKDMYFACIQKAKIGLDSLIESLDFEIPLAYEFYDIYKYNYKQLSDIAFTSDKAIARKAIEETITLMEMLLASWRDLAKEVAKELPPVVGEAPKVYAGLTYGKNGKVEEYIEDSNRGFMA